MCSRSRAFWASKAISSGVWRCAGPRHCRSAHRVLDNARGADRHVELRTGLPQPAPHGTGHPRGGRGLGGGLRSTQAAWLVNTALKRGGRPAGSRGTRLSAPCHCYRYLVTGTRYIDSAGRPARQPGIPRCPVNRTDVNGPVSGGFAGTCQPPMGVGCSPARAVSYRAGPAGTVLAHARRAPTVCQRAMQNVTRHRQPASHPPVCLRLRVRRDRPGLQSRSPRAPARRTPLGSARYGPGR